LNENSSLFWINFINIFINKLMWMRR